MLNLRYRTLGRPVIYWLIFLRQFSHGFLLQIFIIDCVVPLSVDFFEHLVLFILSKVLDLVVIDGGEARDAED